jgi:hypothetical protein
VGLRKQYTGETGKILFADEQLAILKRLHPLKRWITGDTSFVMENKY